MADAVLKGMLLTRDEAWTAYLVFKHACEDKRDKTDDEYRRLVRLRDGYNEVYERIYREELQARSPFPPPPPVEFE